MADHVIVIGIVVYKIKASLATNGATTMEKPMLKGEQKSLNM